MAGKKRGCVLGLVHRTSGGKMGEEGRNKVTGKKGVEERGVEKGGE